MRYLALELRRGSLHCELIGGLPLLGVTEHCGCYAFSRSSFLLNCHHPFISESHSGACSTAFVWELDTSRSICFSASLFVGTTSALILVVAFQSVLLLNVSAEWSIVTRMIFRFQENFSSPVLLCFGVKTEHMFAARRGYYVGRCRSRVRRSRGQCTGRGQRACYCLTVSYRWLFRGSFQWTRARCT